AAIRIRARWRRWRAAPSTASACRAARPEGERAGRRPARSRRRGPGMRAHPRTFGRAKGLRLNLRVSPGKSTRASEHCLEDLGRLLHRALRGVSLRRLVRADGQLFEAVGVAED